QPAPAPVGLLHHALDVLTPGDVDPDRGLAQLGRQLLDPGAIDVGQHESGAFGGEPPRAGPADPARRPCDQYAASRQRCHPSILLAWRCLDPLALTSRRVPSGPGRPGPGTCAPQARLTDTTTYPNDGGRTMGTTTRWMTVVAAALAIGVAGVAHGGGPTNDRSGPSADAQSAQVKGNTEFCFNLYAKLRDRDGNLFFSPYSMSTALAMTSAGARGPTADQMVSTLHLPPGGDRLHQAFGQLNQRVTRAGSARKNELAVANALWSQAGLRILPGFQRITRDLYGAGLQTVDFARAPEKARATINAWVEQQTQDRI